MCPRTFHEGLWSVLVQILLFLTSELNGGEKSASCPGRFTPREIAPGIHRKEGVWMDLEPNWTLWKRHKVLGPARNQTTAPRIPTPYPSHFTN
jgi:hypothetical protein